MAFHGSTIRFYDASVGTWNSAWSIRSTAA